MIMLVYCTISFVIGFYLGSFFSDKIMSYVKGYSNAKRSELI